MITAREERLTGAERFIILTGAIASALSFTLMVPILPKIQNAFAMDAAEAVKVRVALTIVGIALMIGAPLAGWIIDRIGMRLLLIVSLGIWIVAGCLCTVAPDLDIIIGLRFVQGFAAAANIVVAAALLGRMPPGHARGRLAGIEVMIATVGSFLMLIVAGYVGDINWRFVFLLHLAVLPPFVGAFFLPRDGKTRIHHAAGVEDGGFWRLYPWRLTWISLLTGVVIYGPTTYMPFRFRDLGIASPHLIGLMMTAPTVTSALSAALFGWVRKHVDNEHAFLAQFSIAALGAAGAGLLPDYRAATACLFLFGLGAGGMAPNVIELVSSVSVRRRGRVAGIVKGINYGAALIGVLIFQPIMIAAGPGAVLLTIGLGSVVLTILLIGKDRKLVIA